MNIKQYIWYKTEEKQTLKLSGKFTYRLILALVKLLAFIAKWILNNTSGIKQNKTKSGKFTYHLILALVKLFAFMANENELVSLKSWRRLKCPAVKASNTSQAKLFFSCLFLSVNSELTWLPLLELKFETLVLYRYWHNNQMSRRMKIFALPFLTSSGKLAPSLRF